LDAVSGALLDAGIGLLKPLGRVVVYGAASGDFAAMGAAVRGTKPL
jgi:NADPH:quinone reductase-like Zn-dependent oxidoreductase